ncbi:cupin domain-containing protein [Niveibacterium terrae]|uniref:cupin domain-containing protein n=1 Tax=Niveibacterium terrae TaxID=3373598 RepID=UPI003A8D7DB2
MNKAHPQRTGSRFTAVDLGPQSALVACRFEAPSGQSAPGKVFLREALNATGAEISWNCLPPGAAMPFLHAHREHEEIYLFTGGEGEFQVDGEIFPVSEGSAVRVAPEGARAWRNTGSEALSFLVLQVRPGSISGGPVEDGYPLSTELSWTRGA